MRSRKREDLNAEILEGHQSTLLAHLGNISYRLGENVPFDRVTKAFDGNQTFGESFENMKRHLADTGQMDLANTTYRLGRTLQFDAHAEKFVGSQDANQLLTRPYRAPIVVPEQI